MEKKGGEIDPPKMEIYSLFTIGLYKVPVINVEKGGLLATLKNKKVTFKVDDRGTLVLCCYISPTLNVMSAFV